MYRKARIHGEPAAIILISDLVDLKQMIRAINQNDVFQFLLRPFDDEVIASIGENAHKDYIIRTVQAQLKTTVSAYRQVNQVLEDQLNAAHITGEYPRGRAQSRRFNRRAKRGADGGRVSRTLPFFRYL